MNHAVHNDQNVSHCLLNQDWSVQVRKIEDMELEQILGQILWISF